MKQKRLSTIFLGLSILMGSWFIAEGLKAEKKEIHDVYTNGSTDYMTVNLVKDKEEEKEAKADEFDIPLLTSYQLRDYLNISREQIMLLVDESYSFHIPYIKIESQYYFSKSAVDEWLLNNLENRKYEWP
ncbi:helix-turn-helix domain-containing protein [Chengkuizengella marina]|uniref:DNA-binding protein n=1 Tax=Chengkuizengella marina TaxID=2507566 RepID=A0A6N9Q7X3_9BACL|nr:helix-turn-helix domain-containing protein [Chengkuizengella marina]NBI30850.1 DNA-binding protein [Chengkuizengella marina]